MLSDIKTGFFAEQSDFTLYTNNTDKNVRVIFNYLSIEGTGTSEVRVLTPGITHQLPKFVDEGNLDESAVGQTVEYVQLPNLPDLENDWIEGIIGNKLSADALSYGWYWRRWWGYSRNRDNGGSNPHGYMFLTSREEKTEVTKWRYFGNYYNWWRKWGRQQEVPFPVEIFLAPGQSIQFIVRTGTTRYWKTNQTLTPKPQQITYNVLIMQEG